MPIHATIHQVTLTNKEIPSLPKARVPPTLKELIIPQHRPSHHIFMASQGQVISPEDHPEITDHRDISASHPFRILNTISHSPMFNKKSTSQKFFEYSPLIIMYSDCCLTDKTIFDKHGIWLLFQGFPQTHLHNRNKAPRRHDKNSRWYWIGDNRTLSTRPSVRDLGEM